MPVVRVCVRVGVGGFVVRLFIAGVLAAGVVALVVAPLDGVVNVGVVEWAASASATPPPSGGAAPSPWGEAPRRSTFAGGADGAAGVWKSCALGNP